VDVILIQALNGLAASAALFLLAAGLSLIFGVTRVVNFAHGSFAMLGAYLAWWLTGALAPGLGGAGFWVGILLAALAVGLVAALVEILLLRRLYGAPELFQLLATFALVLVIADLALLWYGPEQRVGPRAPGLAGGVAVPGGIVPAYDIVLMGLGPAVLALLQLLLQRTRFGMLIRAATENRALVAAFGIDQRRLFTAVFALGSALAGLAGALMAPRATVHLGLDLSLIVEAFVVVVIGGLGSVPGAFLGALLIGQVHAFGIVLFPSITLVVVFLVMAAVLVVRPHGLLGKPEDGGPAPGAAGGLPAAPLAPPRAAGIPFWLAAIALLAAAPLLLGGFELEVLSEVAIDALIAASLQFLTGLGGIVSFGHACYVGLGAYAVALSVKQAGFGMLAALVLAPLAGLAGGAIFGALCVRLSGVYRAMLTLACAQIVYAIAHQWTEVTGGDNGILGIWPDRWAGEPARYWWLVLAIVAPALWFLRRVAHAPFGLSLRALRDSPRRAEVIGLWLYGRQWAAFALAGAAAGLAGGLLAFLKGTVFPESLGIPVSVEALAMMLLGGVNSLNGPILGAATFRGLRVFVAAETDLWRLVLGGVLILLCLAFPEGLAGAGARLTRHLRAERGR